MSDKVVNINTVGVSRLEELPGIGSALAKAIIDYRSENGFFEHVDELINVRGMTKAKIMALEGRLVVEDGAVGSPEAGQEQPQTDAEGRRVWSRRVEWAVSEVGTDKGRNWSPTSQYGQVGRLVDMWATLLDGFGQEDRAFQLVEGVYEAFEEREIIGVKNRQVRELVSTGLVAAPYRDMVFYKRKQASVIVYFGTQGNDLYISWRAFLQGLISWLRVATVVLAVALLAALASVETEVSFRETSTSFNSETFFQTFFVVGAVVGVLSVIWGFAYRQGDYLALYRAPLSEFQVDDVMSLIYAVHETIKDAATKMGVDIAKLEKYEPFCAPKNRVRGRF